MTPTPAGTDAAALIEARPEHAARVSAIERVLRDVKTEVLSQQALAEEFGISKNYVRGRLERMDGAEKVGRAGWRVPLLKMPPTYLAAVGVIRPGDLDAA